MSRAEEKANDGSRIGKRVGNGRRRLTDADYIRVLSLYADGLSDREIGAMFGVVSSRIWQIRQGRRRPSVAFREPPPRRVREHIHDWATEDGVSWCIGCAAERSPQESVE